MKDYLHTLNLPKSCTPQEMRGLKRNCAKYFMDGQQRKIHNKPFDQIVVTNQQQQRKIMERLHDNLGHRGKDETYRRIVLRF